MNALNLISSRVIGQSPSPSRPRSRSQGEALTPKQSEEILRGRSYSEVNIAKANERHSRRSANDDEGEKAQGQPEEEYQPPSEEPDEKTSLIEVSRSDIFSDQTSLWQSLVRRIADALTALLGLIGAPLAYISQSLQDDSGRFSAIIPFKRMRRKVGGNEPSKSASGMVNPDTEDEKSELEKPIQRILRDTKLKHKYSTDSLRSTTSESESERKTSVTFGHGRASKVKAEDKEGPKRRQSIRIKLNNEEALKKRKQKRNALTESSSDGQQPQPQPPLTVDTIKSPTSPSPSLKVTRYPHAPQPPRPLVPRRQPSYSNLIPRSPTPRTSPPALQQKTLILDLDETLIHSLAKGGRMSSGHMVEVKLNTPVALSPTHTGQPPPILGPQHPILYYVHKRPHCEEFLRKVCKWYKLVVFTASVQEYADPVIDWLEQERKYFVGRYYRQHCTFRNGAYIKDLSSIEPDLSKVIILDNSPVSYIFHEDNAIPIEGWINDPTDNDLLHLIPMLEALQYATDVRALLALRRGEAETT